MRLSRALVVALATPLLVTAAATGAEAAGGGSNYGTIGVVYNNVTQGGLTLNGSCHYYIDDTGLTISGQASASGSVAITLTCIVRHWTFATEAARMGGSAVTVLETGHVPVPGTKLCIRMVAVTLTAATVNPPEFCV